MRFSRPTCFHEMEFRDDLRKDVQDGLCREKIIIKGKYLLERDIIKIGSKNKIGKQYIFDVKKFRHEKNFKIHADDDIALYLTYIPDNFIYCLTQIKQREPNFLDLTNQNIFSQIKKLGDWSVIILKEKEFQEQFVSHYKSFNLQMQYVNYHKKEYFENKENCLTPFDKIIDYEYQKEYRVAIELKSQNQVEYLNMGNIEKLGFICPSIESIYFFGLKNI